MHPVLSKNLFFVQEHLGLFKAANNYDIIDPATGEVLMHCRENNLGFFTRFFRFSDYKTMTPFHITISSAEGEKILTVKRGVTFFYSKVIVLDAEDNPVGSFHQQLFSIGGKFKVLDKDDNQICTLKGKWTSWEFKFMHQDRELGRVTKQWAGLGRELFTSADNYVLQIADQVPPDNSLRMLILAAVMCIDMVLKE